MTEQEEPWLGVTVPAGGDLQIPAGAIRINVETGEVSPITVKLRTDIWPHWLEIARGALAQATTARDTNPGLSSGSPIFDSALQQELRSSMVSICSAAFAVEAFANSVHHHVPSSKLPAKSATGRVHRTLTYAFKLTNEQSKVARRAEPVVRSPE